MGETFYKYINLSAFTVELNITLDAQFTLIRIVYSREKVVTLKRIMIERATHVN